MANNTKQIAPKGKKVTRKVSPQKVSVSSGVFNTAKSVLGTLFLSSLRMNETAKRFEKGEDGKLKKTKLAADGVQDDPFANTLHSDGEKRVDETKFVLEVSNTAVPDSYEDLSTTAAKRLVWMIPEMYRNTTGGDTKADERGQLAGIEKVTITFKNTLEDDHVTIKGSAPVADVGSLAERAFIRSRIKQTDVRLRPGEQRSIAIRYGDKNNMFGPLIFKASDGVSSTFKRNYIGLFDFVTIVPNINNKTGEAYSATRGAVEVTASITYVATKNPTGTEGIVINSFQAYALQAMTDIRTIFHVDPRLIPDQLGVGGLATPVMVQPDTTNSNKIGVRTHTKNGRLGIHLVYLDNLGQSSGPVQFRSHSSTDNIITIPALSIGMHITHPNQSPWFTGSVCSFRYDRNAGHWELIRGTEPWVDNFPTTGYYPEAPATTPCWVYSDLPPTLVKEVRIPSGKFRTIDYEVEGVIDTIEKVLSTAGKAISIIKLFF